MTRLHIKIETARPGHSLGRACGLYEIEDHELQDLVAAFEDLEDLLAYARSKRKKVQIQSASKPLLTRETEEAVFQHLNRYESNEDLPF